VYTEVTELILNGQGNVAGLRVWDRATDSRREIRGDMVINATGAWAGQMARLAGANVTITPTPGVMVAFDRRLAQRPINRLNKPGDGDIIVPQRRMAIVGTTSFEVTDMDYVPVIKDQIELMVERGAELVPALAKTNQRGAFVATRPLVGHDGGGRSLARTFKCFDHKETHGIDNFVTITGGKATTLRMMAEKTADVVCAKLGISAPCTTRETPLQSYRRYWVTEAAPRREAVYV
jgi:glycerol-3-phosphate dehydrogenase